MDSKKIRNVKGGLLTVKQASKELQLHEEYLRQLAREKRIPAYKIRGCWMFVPQEVRQSLDIPVPNMPGKVINVSPEPNSIAHLF